MLHRYPIFFIFCFCVGLQAFGQQVFVLKGVISKKSTAERVPQVLIKNLRSHDIMMSDELGWFSVKAAIGDTLVFNKNDYTEQKITVTSTTDMPVYMQPVIKLDVVTVQGQSKRQEINDVMSEYRSQGTFYDGKPPVLSFLTSPITGIYELFGKTPNEAKRFASYSKGEMEYAEVRRRYTVKLVKQVTGTSDSTARKFMEYYTPSYEDLKAWNDYDLIKNIKKSYGYYDKNKDKLKLQNINAPLLINADGKKP